MVKITAIASIEGIEAQLNELLLDCVASGASVGFMLPFAEDEAGVYWQAVASELTRGERLLLLADDGNTIVGAVQLSLCHKPNGNHRGEVEKLMVHRAARGQGIGKRLLVAIEDLALQRDLSLLVLDTRLGDVAESLYRAQGYIEAGQIPAFARSTFGELCATVIFYKQLAMVQTEP